MTTLREPHMVGAVRIGTPDDYVMRFLPGILSRFAQAYPLVQVEVHCDSSSQLMQRQDLDLTILTRAPGTEIGELLRQERFVWAEAVGHSPHEQAQMPLAMFNTDCFCRAWACNALDTLGRAYRVAYTSPSLSAIMAVVSAGLAVTAQLQSLITADMRILGEAEGLPLLPSCSIVLMRNPRSTSPVTDTLAEHIIEGSACRPDHLIASNTAHTSRNTQNAVRSTRSGRAWARRTPQLMLSRPPRARGTPMAQSTWWLRP